MRQVILSNGYGQFPIARLAENLHQRGALAALLTGAYPKSGLQRLLKLSSGSDGLRRLMERGVDIPDRLVRPYWRGELPHQMGQVLGHRGRASQAERLVAKSMDGYAAWAARSLASFRGDQADVYHFRAGMGGSSLDKATSLGMKVLCDHSIVHPRTLAGLVNGNGGLTTNLNALWSRVDADIQRADALIVNSEFVASTCRAAGIVEIPIFVAYTGVDPSLIRVMDGVAPTERWNSVRGLFAGTLEKRKGIDTVVRAIRLVSQNTAEWTIIGSWELDSSDVAASLPDHVVHKKPLPHSQLAVEMVSANLFVFPSRAEGSARVVAEALTAGCYVITTENAGSITRDGIDGRLIRPGDDRELARAVDEYASMAPSERQARSIETMRYARAKLNEGAYTSSVMSAYGK